MKIERGPDPGPLSDPARYKPHLRPLFRCRCAYCLTPDDRLGGEEGMTVDHFRPIAVGRYPHLRLAWSNLYYACSICNSRYKIDHPRPDEEAEGKRFVDPCEEDPDDHFRLVCDTNTDEPCRVRPLSAIAEYTVWRLKLNCRKQLRDFWRSIHHDELRLLAREHEIRQRLDDCAKVIHANGLNDEMQRLQADYEEQRAIVLAKIEATRQLRPFPVESSC
jgi:uncharacterized protein (TIGR02646 family)